MDETEINTDATELEVDDRQGELDLVLAPDSTEFLQFTRPDAVRLGEELKTILKSLSFAYQFEQAMHFGSNAENSSEITAMAYHHDGTFSEANCVSLAKEVYRKLKSASTYRSGKFIETYRDQIGFQLNGTRSIPDSQVYHEQLTPYSHVFELRGTLKRIKLRLEFARYGSENFSRYVQGYSGFGKLFLRMLEGIGLPLNHDYHPQYTLSVDGVEVCKKSIYGVGPYELRHYVGATIPDAYNRGELFSYIYGCAVSNLEMWGLDENLQPIFTPSPELEEFQNWIRTSIERRSISKVPNTLIQALPDVKAKIDHMCSRYDPSVAVMSSNLPGIIRKDRLFKKKLELAAQYSNVNVSVIREKVLGNNWEVLREDEPRKAEAIIFKVLSQSVPNLVRSIGLQKAVSETVASADENAVAA